MCVCVCVCVCLDSPRGQVPPLSGASKKEKADHLQAARVRAIELIRIALAHASCFHDEVQRDRSM